MRVTALLVLAVVLGAAVGQVAADSGTLLQSIISSKRDSKDCGKEGKPCCKNMRCSGGANVGCVPVAGQTPMCVKCGKHQQPCCPGQKCAPGYNLVSGAGVLPMCVQARQFVNPKPRKPRQSLPRSAFPGAAAASVPASVPGSDAAAVDAATAAVPEAVSEGADTAAAVNPPAVVDGTDPVLPETEAAALADDNRVDLSAGMIWHPCRDQVNFPGMVPCDAGGKCQYNTASSPGICMPDQ